MLEAAWGDEGSKPALLFPPRGFRHFFARPNFLLTPAVKVSGWPKPDRTGHRLGRAGW